jgi:hypothetical protein
MREAGISQATPQDVVGHASPEIQQLYTHTDAQALERAVKALPSLDGKTSTATETAAMIEADAVLELAKSLARKMFVGSKLNYSHSRVNRI